MRLLNPFRKDPPKRRVVNKKPRTSYKTLYLEAKARCDWYEQRNPELRLEYRRANEAIKQIKKGKSQTVLFGHEQEASQGLPDGGPTV